MIQLSSSASVIRHVSFSNTNGQVIIVTGKDVYKFYMLSDNANLKQLHSSFARKDDQQPLSTNFVCHTWLADGKFIVCTDIGQILLFEQSGDFKQVTIETKDPKYPIFPINSCLSFTLGDGQPLSGKQQAKTGFVIAGDSGHFRVFFKQESADRNPYKRTEGTDLNMQDQDAGDQTLQNDVKYHKITSMALSPRQDLLVFGTDANQILKVQINMERPHEADRYEYLISSFHSKSVIGMDVCIKKNIVATCSTDRTVRIWSFDSAGKLIVPTPQKKDAGPLVKTFQEETYSLALHPSGFHIVIGFADCVKMMNILSNNLEPFKSIQIKNCKEIQFSHGGQYFACQSAQSIQVFKFYTGESSPDFFFRGH